MSKVERTKFISKDSIEFMFVPYSHHRSYGYIRLEDKRTGEYLGSIDERMTKRQLRLLRNTINSFIRKAQK